MRADETRRWWRWLALAASLTLVAALTLLPIGWQLNRFVVWLYFEGLRLSRSPLAFIGLDGLAFLLNVVLMVPAALLARLALPRLPAWVVPAVIIAASAAIEVAQWLLPLGREASLLDVLANGLGGAVGAWMVPRILRGRRWRLGPTNGGRARP